MKPVRLPVFIAALFCSASLSLAQRTNATSTTYAAGACPTVLTPPYGAPVVGSGWTAQLVATNLTRPRGIVFDQGGALLVVQQGSGIARLTFTDYGGTCLVVNETTTVVENPDLNHSVQLSADGCTLYASTSDEVFRWPYDAAAGTVGDNETLVTNMSNTDHVSRTLLLSRKANNTLLVSRGSSGNMDMAAAQLDSGHSQIRSFDIRDLPGGQPYDYPFDGRLIGWGLRNSVAVAEHPVTGGIYSAENSADEAERDGVDIHEDNPGEEMNFHGFLNDSSAGGQGGNYGYPVCFALWGTGDFPEKGDLTVGSQFALNLSGAFNDTTCAEEYVAPRLTFQAHSAPLDMLFSADGSTAYVTFHGSWDRTNPVGYVLSSVQFDSTTGEPVAPPDSTDATADVLSNADLSRCPDGCFRPVGLAWDAQGRLFVSSDSTGEIYVLQQADFSASGGDGMGTGTASETGTSPVSTSTIIWTSGPNLGPRSSRNRPGGEAVWLTCLAVVLCLVRGVLFTCT